MLVRFQIVVPRWPCCGGVRPSLRGGAISTKSFAVWNADRGPASSVYLQTGLSLPDNGFIGSPGCRALPYNTYVCIDFFLNETAQYADIILPGSLHEEARARSPVPRAASVKINKAVDCPGEARQDSRTASRTLPVPLAANVVSRSRIRARFRRTTQGVSGRHRGLCRCHL